MDKLNSRVAKEIQYYNFYQKTESSPRPALGFKNLRTSPRVTTGKFLNDPAIEVFDKNYNTVSL